MARPPPPIPRLRPTHHPHPRPPRLLRPPHPPRPLRPLRPPHQPVRTRPRPHKEDPRRWRTCDFTAPPTTRSFTTGDAGMYIGPAADGGGDLEAPARGITRPSTMADAGTCIGRAADCGDELETARLKLYCSRAHVLAAPHGPPPQGGAGSCFERGRATILPHTSGLGWVSLLGRAGAAQIRVLAGAHTAQRKPHPQTKAAAVCTPARFLICPR